MKKLFRFLLSLSPLLVISSVLIGALGGLATTGLLAVINEALTGEGSAAYHAIRFAALAVVVAASSVLSRVLAVRLSQKGIFSLLVHLSQQVVATPLARLERIGPARILAVLTEDVRMLSEVLLVFRGLCVNTAVMLGCLVYLVWLSWEMALATALFIALGGGAYHLLSSRAMRSLRRARQARDRLFKHLRSLVEGVKELKLNRLRRAAFFSQSLSDSADSLQRHHVTGISRYALAGGIAQAWFIGWIGILLFALPALGNASAQTRVGYVLVLLYVISPMSSLLDMLPLMARARVSLYKIEELELSLHKAAPLARAKSDGKEVETWPDWRRLELREAVVSYRRKDGRGFQLGPLNLKIDRGELIFLVGGNGSGKTTLAKLLTGLYSPREGEVCIDGTPLTQDLLESYRQLFSVVFAEFHLFDRLYGAESEAEKEKAARLLARLALEKEVEIEQGRLSTTSLSTGQRKRLALLAAYLEDRPIYLFDEWAADQDPVFKDVFYNQLILELKAAGKTVLVISHDERFYHLADRIVKLEEGRIVASGNGPPALGATLGQGTGSRLSPAAGAAKTVNSTEV